ncbi:MAG: hypothetical protein A2075_05840 [Geobacteraceae bacterium GWC2_58_44]|nr:MAG: hypothetical protein A2075_05840 [Geobacteraceae bacterium GWC2_58_44]HBG06886.1 hypothetical protein [Geobacter sp.]
MFLLLFSASAWGAPVVIPLPQPAMNSISCVGTRNLGTMNCTAKEFTVGSSFSAAPGTPPFCIAGQSFSFQVDLSLSGSNANRYNMAFYTGETGNDPQIDNASQLCSVATFPTFPAPYNNFDGDACGDYAAQGDSIITINQIKSLCQGDSTGALEIPYTLTYFQNTTTTCSGPLDVQVPPTSKCQSNISPVNGTVAVFSGAYVDVTKQTAPDGDSQPFSFTATGPAGSKVIALTGAALSPTSAIGGTYYPATIAAATNSTTVTLRDNETARFYINALTTDQILTITEAAAGNWESTAAISCSAVTGAPALITDDAGRSISATLNSTNSAAACTITNTKRSRITLRKQVAGRIAAADQFRVSASGGGTLTGTTSATTSGSGTSATTTFFSTPGAALTLTDAKTAGATPFSGYAASLTCSNAFSGPGATAAASLPNQLFTSAYSFAPSPGDDITCTYTNTPRATLSKSYTPATIGAGGSSTLTFAISNGATNPAQSGLAFTDTFPAGVTVTAVGAISGAGCSGTPSFTASTVSLAAGGISAGNGTCTFSATVRGDTGAAAYPNDSTRFSSQGGGLNTDAATATLNVYAPPTVAKSFGAATIPAGGSTTLILTLANPAANLGAITGVRVDDSFPAGLTLQNATFAFTPAACGTVTKTSGAASAVGDNNLRFSVASLAPGATCQLSVNVTSSTLGGITNSAAAPTATGPAPLAGVSADAALAVYGLPLISIVKSADRASANPGQVVVYTVQIVNTGTGEGSNVVLTDDLSPYGAFDLGAGAPFNFTDSSPASGLSLGVPQYSSNNAATWLYSPLSGGGGAPPGFDGSVTNWRMPMIGSIRAGGSFMLNYRIRVK